MEFDCAAPAYGAAGLSNRWEERTGAGFLRRFSLNLH
jgi:hypothetical protein